MHYYLLCFVIFSYVYRAMFYYHVNVTANYIIIVDIYIAVSPQSAIIIRLF